MLRIFVLFVLLAGFRCDSVSTTGVVCTDIGCDSGLTVMLQSPPDAPYRIEVHVSGSSVRYIQTCSSQTACGSTAFFSDFTPERVIVEVISALGTERYEARPTYQRNQPNGPGCDPVCWTAAVRLPQDAID